MAFGHDGTIRFSYATSLDIIKKGSIGRGILQDVMTMKTLLCLILGLQLFAARC